MYCEFNAIDRRSVPALSPRSRVDGRYDDSCETGFFAVTTAAGVRPPGFMESFQHKQARPGFIKPGLAIVPLPHWPVSLVREFHTRQPIICQRRTTTERGCACAALAVPSSDHRFPSRINSRRHALHKHSFNLERSSSMPRKKTIRKAMQDKRAGKSLRTQAGEFVREEMDKIRRGEHGARSARQAIAIGLSEAR